MPEIASVAFIKCCLILVVSLLCCAECSTPQSRTTSTHILVAWSESTRGWSTSSTSISLSEFSSLLSRWLKKITFLHSTEPSEHEICFSWYNNSNDGTEEDDDQIQCLIMLLKINKQIILRIMVINIFILFTAQVVCCQCSEACCCVFGMGGSERERDCVAAVEEGWIRLNEKEMLVIPWFNNSKFNFHQPKHHETEKKATSARTMPREMMPCWGEFEMKFRGKIGREAKLRWRDEKKSFSSSSNEHRTTVRNEFPPTWNRRDRENLSQYSQWVRSSETSISLRSSASELVIWWNFNLTHWDFFHWNGKKRIATAKNLRLKNVYNWNSQEFPSLPFLLRYQLKGIWN